MKDPIIKRNFQAALRTNIQEFREDNVGEDVNINEEWQKLKTVTTKTMEEVLKPDKTNKRNKQWFDQDCEDIVTRSKEMRKIWLSNTDDVEKKTRYEECCREAKRTIRAKKRKYIEDKIDQAEKDRTKNNAKEFYRTTRFFRKGYTPRIDLIKDKDGNLIADEAKALEEWKQYFEKLLNGGDMVDHSIEEWTYLNEEEIEPPNLDEVMKVIKRLKSGKAAGGDMIPSEVLKNGGEELTLEIWKLICKIWECEQTPDDWKEAIVCPVFKKGDVMICGNYRGISLLCITYKVLSMTILNRITPLVESKMGSEQAGFRKNRSTIDQIHNLRQIL